MEACFRKILLADDDEDHAILFSKILVKVYPDALLVAIHDGEALIDYLRKETIDLLFLDLNLPCKQGIECLRQIRKNLNLTELPIIVYSSSAHMPDIVMSYSNNANLYIVKPFNGEHLENALKAIFLNLDWINTSSSRKYYFINNRFVPFTITN
jgi:DNA-binding response OmpR family regulator